MASSGTLIVTNDTTLSEDHRGSIHIDADNVTLDCAGHTVTGPGDSENGIYFSERTGVVVKNCRVTGFTFGLLVDRSTAFTLRNNVSFGHVGHGFNLGLSSRGVLHGNRARENGGNGFAIESGSIGNTLTENLAVNNQSHRFLDLVWVRLECPSAQRLHGQRRGICDRSLERDHAREQHFER